MVLGLIGPFAEELTKRSFDWLSQVIREAKAGPKWQSKPFQTSGHFYRWEKGKPKLEAKCLVIARGKLGKPDEAEMYNDSFWSANYPLAKRLKLQAPPSFYFEALLRLPPDEKPMRFALVPQEVCLYKPGNLKPSSNGKYSITVGIAFTHVSSSSIKKRTPLGISVFRFTDLEPGGENACTKAPQGIWNSLPPNTKEGDSGLVNIDVLVTETGTDSSLFQVLTREGNKIAKLLDPK